MAENEKVVEVVVDGLPVMVDRLAYRENKTAVVEAVRGARAAERLLDDTPEAEDYTVRVGHDE